MMAGLLLPGIQSARVMTAENAVIRIMTLNRPILSATMPGTIRPNILVSVSGILSSKILKKAIRVPT
jgi:hypothetical protein